MMKTPGSQDKDLAARSEGIAIRDTEAYPVIVEARRRGASWSWIATKLNSLEIRPAQGVEWTCHEAQEYFKRAGERIPPGHPVSMNRL